MPSSSSSTAAATDDAPPPSYHHHPPPPRTTSPPSLRSLPAYTPSRWGNYASEADYLAALRAWVEEKQYVSAAAPGERHALVGFYGAKTMSDYAGGVGGGKKKERRKSEALVGEGGMQGEGEGEGGRRRKSSLGEWLRGRRAGGGGVSGVGRGGEGRG
ncbi:hypothetical protein MMC26_006293 [Xylographa opegraphella]|nr:hypothetical protein [Xylographa opegraphella]